MDGSAESALFLSRLEAAKIEAAVDQEKKGSEARGYVEWLLQGTLKT